MKKKNIIDESERKTQDMSAVADFDGESSNRAKLVEAFGDDYEETKPGPVTVDGVMANFWYHYKWHTIISAFVLVFLVIGIIQLRSNNPSDVTALYAYEGPDLESVVSISMGNAFSEALTTDTNNNGKIRAYVLAVSAYSDFQQYLLTGEMGVMLLGQSYYDEMKNAGGLARLDDIFDQIPEGAIDEYGIRLSETKIAKYYSCFKYLPEDVVLCLRVQGAPSVMHVSKSKIEKMYEKNKSFFVDIMNFEYPEGFAE